MASVLPQEYGVSGAAGVSGAIRHDFSKTKVLAQILASIVSKYAKWPKLRTPVFIFIRYLVCL